MQKRQIIHHPEFLTRKKERFAKDKSGGGIINKTQGCDSVACAYIKLQLIAKSAVALSVKGNLELEVYQPLNYLCECISI